MTISAKHAFASAKSDGGDATLVKPSDWNAEHTITLATQRTLGRNTAGTGAVEEVTASQLLDWVSSTNGALLARLSGTWAAAPGLTFDTDGAILSVVASPSAPSAGAKLVAQTVAGRTFPAYAAPLLSSKLQPLIPNKAIMCLRPSPGNSATSGFGFASSVTGALSVRALASTNFYTKASRTGVLSAGGAGSVAGIRATAGAAMRDIGFFVVWRFGVGDASLVATANMFVGLSLGGAPTDVAPSTLTNEIGVGCDNGDTHLQLYAAGAAAQARTDLGASFPVNTISTDLYELTLFCPPTGTDIKWNLVRLNTGDTTSGTISAGANLPSTTQLLTPQLWRSNGGTATAVLIDFGGYYQETEY